METRGDSRWVEAGDVRLHCLRYGAGERAIVIVPGISQPAVTWEFVALELCGAHTVYVADPRGRGLSDKPAAGYGLADYARDLAGIVRGLRLERPVVLGHSMGARIVAAFGALNPDLPGASIIVDPPLSGPGRDPFPVPLDVYLDALRAAKAGATADDMRPAFPTWTDAQLRIRAESLRTCEERAIVESYRGFNEEDFFGWWRALRAPVLFLYGSESNVVTEDMIPEVAATNPAARIRCVPDAGHVIPWDNLEAFVTEVSSFIESLPTR